MTAPPVVFLDIETLPTTDSPEWRAHAETLPAVVAARRALAALEDDGPKPPPSNYKDPAKIAEARDANLAAHVVALRAARVALDTARADALRATSLDPLWGRVCCIGVAIDDGEPDVLASDDEGLLMGGLSQLVTRLADLKRGPVVYVMHNGRGFDVPFLRVRALVHGRPSLARAFGGWRAKPWESTLVDTMELWPSTGRGAFTRLQAIRRALGLPVQVGIDGSQVAAAWHDGRRDEVIRHCREDVAGLREVYHRIRDVL